MARAKQGDKMDKQESGEAAAQLDAAKGIPQPQNEFAPNVINDGGEGGAREVSPAPTPEASFKREDDSAEAAAAAGLEAPEEDLEAEAAARAASQAKRERDAEREREFVDYVNGDLKQIAEELGYDLVMKKRGAPNVGPVMLYDPATREGQVFANRALAPSHFLTGDQLQAIRDEERAAGIEPK